MPKRKQLQAAINRSSELSGSFNPSNANILDNTTASFTQDLLHEIHNNKAKVDAIANLLGIAFNTDGSINTENYTVHTHSYTDDTISDTADGSGTTTTTSKTTGAVI